MVIVITMQRDLAEFPLVTLQKAELAKLPIEELRRKYLTTLQSEETIRAYGRDIATFLRALDLENGTLGDLEQLGLPNTYAGLFELLRAMLRRDETGKIINAKTFNRVRQGNASFFKYLQLFYGFPYNPAVYVQKLREHRKSTTQDMTEDEVLQILWKLKRRAHTSRRDTRNYLMVLGLTLEALRRRELAALTWDAIDHQQRSITIRQKGDAIKVVPVPSGFLRLLNDYGHQFGKSSSPFIFPSLRRTGTPRPVSVDTIYRVVKAIAREVVPEKRITPHSFRTTFATLGVKWAAPIRAIQNGGGWSSIEMIAYYDRNNPLEFSFIHMLGDRLHKEGII